MKVQYSIFLKEKIRKDRQKERDRRHNQRFGNEDSMPYRVEPEYAKPYSGRYNQANGHRYGSESSGGSELSDTSNGSPNVQRARNARAPSHSRQMIRTNLSDDDLMHERDYIHSDVEMKPKQIKGKFSIFLVVPFTSHFFFDIPHVFPFEVTVQPHHFWCFFTERKYSTLFQNK